MAVLPTSKGYKRDEECPVRRVNWMKEMINIIKMIFFFRVDLLPFDLITQLFKILSIETKKEKG